jgi:hypothetical protein
MRKFALLTALLLAGGCKSTEGPEPQVTTSVQVTSSPTQIAVNETAQASAVVKDQNGQALTGKTISWISLNPTVATVSSTGLIKGVAPGNATINGTVDGVTGSATITVIQPVQSCLTGPTTIEVATGAVRVISSNESKGCIKIASTNAASTYLVIAANLNAQPDVLAQFALKSDEGETVPNTTLLTPPARIAAQLSIPPATIPGALQTQFEGKMRRTEQRELDFTAGKRAFAAKMATSNIRMSQAVAVPNVGDKTNFKVPAKFDASGTYQGGGCSAFTQVTATVKHVSNRAIIYQDDASPAGGFTDTEYGEIATEFDNVIYPTDVDYFGTPLDQDANSRVIILYTPLVNKLTQPNQNGFVGGFFFVGDLFPVNQCQQSNLAEIFYLLSPDPNGTINNNVRTTTSVRQGTRGTIAHEFQHMINGSERFRNPLAEDFEAVWLDEALAHFAEDVNGRVLRGFNETGNYTDAQLRANFNDYAAFFFQNFARFRLYLANPGPLSPTSALVDTSLAVRGAAWALVRYTADHYAPNGDVKSFIRSLVPGPDTGVVNLTRRAGNIPFDSLDAGWLVANYADDLGVPNLPVKYTYKTYNMRDAVRGATNSLNPVFPLNPALISGSGYSVTGVNVRSGSGWYYTFFRSAGDQARSFRFLNPDLSTAASFVGASLIILRTQ